MEVFEMVVAIVAIVIAGKVLSTWLRQGGPKAGRRFAKRKDLDDALARLEQAEDRIRVLEKIATDADRGLAAEIDQLATSDAAKGASM